MASISSWLRAVRINHRLLVSRTPPSCDCGPDGIFEVLVSERIGFSPQEAEMNAGIGYRLCLFESG